LLTDPAYDRLTRFDWGTDAAGLHSGCCLLRLRPADMIKFGELIWVEASGMEGGSCPWDGSSRR
jgi:hypothetical protein